MIGESFTLNGPHPRRPGHLRRPAPSHEPTTRLRPALPAPGVHQGTAPGRLDGEGGGAAGPGAGRRYGDLVSPRDRAGADVPAVPLGAGAVRGEPLVGLP